MKVVQKSDEYTIYQRRDERYAVKDAKRNWVNGDDKVAVLVAAGLISVAAPAPKEPEPEAETEADAEAADAASEDAASEDAAEGEDS